MAYESTAWLTFLFFTKKLSLSVDEMNVVMPRKLIKDGIKPVSTDQEVAAGVCSLIVRVERQRLQYVPLTFFLAKSAPKLIKLNRLNLSPDCSFEFTPGDIHA